ncbi:MAG: Na+/H+ antiporter subunit D, partial [Pseudomonadota bacterium]
AKEPPANMLWAMGITSLLCLIIGVYPDVLYILLPFASEYRPYNLHHLSEALQILSFTGLVFFLLLAKLSPEEKINLDVDYFYRKGAGLFLKFDDKVIGFFDNLWGELYRTLGLRALFKSADLSYGFDRQVIDGIVDGSATSTLELGSAVRKLQTGKIQTYIALSLMIFFLVVLFAVIQTMKNEF